MPGANAVFTLRDASKEDSVVKVYNGPITAISLPGYLTQLGDFRTALDNLTLCNIAREQWTGDVTELDQNQASNPFAQRELKLKIDYIGDNGSPIRHFTVAGPDLAALTIVNDQIVLADGGVMEAFVTAAEAMMRHPLDDTEAITIVGAEIVGRNT